MADIDLSTLNPSQVTQVPAIDLTRVDPKQVTVVADSTLGKHKDYLQKLNDGFSSFKQLIDLADKEGLDLRSGAPAGVREMVGGAPEKDRLTQIRQFYPDAVPVGVDNFVFTNPTTGKKTLYNPKGLDLGDLASLTRELYETGGGIIGGAAAVPPAVAAAPPTLGTSSALVPLGVGLGAAAGGQVYDLTRKALGGVDTESTGEKMVRAGKDFLINAVGQKGGELVSQALTKFFGWGSPAAMQTMKNAAAEGVPLTAGEATGSQTLQGIEKAISRTPLSTNVMAKAAQQTLDALKASAERSASSLGSATTKQEAGVALKQGFADADNVFTQMFGKAQEAFRQMDALIPPNTPVAVTNTLKSATKDLEVLADKPNVQKIVADPELQKYLTAFVQDMSQEGAAPFTFGQLQAIREAVGKKLGSGGLMADRPALERLYAAITEDMGQAAEKASPEAKQAFESANSLWKDAARQSKEFLAPFLKTESPEKAAQLAMSAGQSNATQLAAIKKAIPAENWNDYASYVVRNLGTAKAGTQDAAGEAFSAATFLTNWNKITPEAKAILFDGEVRTGLDRLAGLAEKVKNADKMSNPSGTAGTIAFLSLLTGGAGTIGGGLESALAGAATAGAVSLGNAGIAKLLTNQAFVNWLVKANSVLTPTQMGQHIVRLGLIAKEADPATRQTLESYIDRIRQASEGQ